MLSAQTRSRAISHFIPPLCLALLLHTACRSLSSTNGESVASEGEGLVSAPLRLPPTVGLRTDDGKKCVGTFIREDLIVTTAQCVEGARGVSVISQHSAFRTIPASRTILLHPEWLLAPDKSAIPGLDFALLVMPKPIAPKTLIAALASSKAKVGSEVALLGFVHKADAKAREEAPDSVMKLTSNRIDSIDPKADGLLKLVSKVKDNEALLDLPYKEDLGGPLYNSKGELIGIAQYADPLTARFVNFNSPRVHDFIQKMLKDSTEGL